MPEILRTRYFKTRPITIITINSLSLQLYSLNNTSSSKLNIDVASKTVGPTFVGHFYLLKLTWRMALHALIDILLLIMVIIKAPISREMKKMRNKKSDKNSLF